MDIPKQTLLMVNAQKFFVDHRIGEGANGGVWKLLDSCGGAHALKLLYRSQDVSHHNLVTTLAILSRIDYRHIVPIEHFGCLPIRDQTCLCTNGVWRAAQSGGRAAQSGDCPFVIMPHATISLSDYLNSADITLHEQLSLGLQLCLAIRKIHNYITSGPSVPSLRFGTRASTPSWPSVPSLRFGTRASTPAGTQGLERFFHGDLKPNNILLFQHRQHMVLKVADLGITTCLDPQNPYLAPEQKQGLPIDYRCDLFATSKIISEILGKQRDDFASLLLEMQAPQAQDRKNSLGELIRRLASEQKRMQERELAYGNFLLGADLLQRGFYKYALQDFDRAITLDANLFIAHLYRADTLRQMACTQEALASYQRAMEIDPADARPYENRGELYAEQGNYQRAIADLEQAITRDPQAASAYGSLGMVYAALEEDDKALEQFTKLISMKDDFAPAYIDRADVLMHLQKYELAASDYQRALQLEIENPDEVRQKLEDTRHEIESQG